jgi:shikimate dehydrogenase
MAADSVFTLADLRAGRVPHLTLAVLGHPIGHSLSPPMHNAALAWLAATDPRLASWRYGRFEVPAPDLPEALPLLAQHGFHGLNLTVPHKVVAVDLVADVDPAARRAGAVNTLRIGPAGWNGFNTDGYGLENAVREAFGAGLRGRSVLLLGAGGAARGAAVECLAQGCARLASGNRTAENRDRLLALLRPLAGSVPLSGFALPLVAGETLPADCLVINATSAGLRASDPAPIELARLPRPSAVFDMIYNPPDTPLLRAARTLGLPAANGLAMLVHQGAKSLEIWTGAPAARTAPIMAAALQTLRA